MKRETVEIVHARPSTGAAKLTSSLTLHRL